MSEEEEDYGFEYPIDPEDDLNEEERKELELDELDFEEQDVPEWYEEEDN